MKSGKSTIYFQGWNYLSGDPKVVVESPTVKRIIGFHCVVNHDLGNTGYVFQVNDNAPDPLIIERFGYGVTVEHTGKRTVVIKHGGINYHAKPGAGDVFFEDVQGDSLVFYKGQHVYMRQLNTEGPKTHIYNKGASLWILGVKTEGRGTVINTTDGGFTEVLGTLL